MLLFRQSETAKPAIGLSPRETMASKLCRVLVFCLDFLIEKMCGIGMLCLLIVLILGFGFICK